MSLRRVLSLLTALIVFTPPAAAADMGLRGWGLRAGLASDPDQVLVGAHWDLGDVAPQLRIVPNAQLGFGDDSILLEGTLPLHYVFAKTDPGFVPYVGGGLAVAWIDVDHEGNPHFDDDDFDDSDVELGLKATGGMEWGLRSGNRFLVELNLGIGDLHDFQVVAGWTF